MIIDGASGRSVRAGVGLARLCHYWPLLLLALGVMGGQIQREDCLILQ